MPNKNNQIITINGPEQRQKWITDTILDKGSFKGATDSWATNEGIIANWTPVAIRLNPAFFKDSYIPAQAKAVDKKLAMLAGFGLPIYDELGDEVDPKQWT